MSKFFGKLAVYAILFFATSFAIWFGYLTVKGPVPTVLMYHSIGEPNSLAPSLITPVDVFERQMAFFSRHRYNVITLEAFVTGLQQRKKFPAKTIVLTFDDGYGDNYKNAFPILRKYGFPATIFVITGEIITGQDVLGRRTGFLTLAEMKEMQASGLIAFGVHTMHHLFLPEMADRPDAMYQEVVQSKKDLELMLGVPAPFFCYPAGQYSRPVQLWVRRAGYRAAVTTAPVKGYIHDDLYAIKRVKMDGATDNSFLIFAKTGGYYQQMKEMPH